MVTARKFEFFLISVCPVPARRKPVTVSCAIIKGCKQTSVGSFFARFGAAFVPPPPPHLHADKGPPGSFSERWAAAMVGSVSEGAAYSPLGTPLGTASKKYHAETANMFTCKGESLLHARLLRRVKRPGTTHGRLLGSIVACFEAGGAKDGKRSRSTWRGRCPASLVPKWGMQAQHAPGRVVEGWAGMNRRVSSHLVANHADEGIAFLPELGFFRHAFLNHESASLTRRADR